MVIALLVCLAGTVATGIVAYGERGKGPLTADGTAIVTVARARKTKAAPGKRKASSARSPSWESYTGRWPTSPWRS